LKTLLNIFTGIGSDDVTVSFSGTGIYPKDPMPMEIHVLTLRSLIDAVLKEVNDNMEEADLLSKGEVVFHKVSQRLGQKYTSDKITVESVSMDNIKLEYEVKVEK
jgi:hypothetical protein